AENRHSMQRVGPEQDRLHSRRRAHILRPDALGACIVGKLAPPHQPSHITTLGYIHAPTVTATAVAPVSTPKSSPNPRALVPPATIKPRRASTSYVSGL